MLTRVKNVTPQKDFKLAAAEALQNANEQFLSHAIQGLDSVKREADLSIDFKKPKRGAIINIKRAKPGK